MSKPKNYLTDDNIRNVRHLHHKQIEEALLILLANQTMDERQTDDTKHKNSRGFTKGTAVWGTRLAKKVIAQQPWDAQELIKARSIVAIHQKQLMENGYIPPPPTEEQKKAVRAFLDKLNPHNRIKKESA